MKKILYLLTTIIIVLFIFNGNVKADASLSWTCSGTKLYDATTPNIDISDEEMTCYELLGTNLVNILHLFIQGVRVVGAIITIILGVMKIIPAITDPSKMKSCINSIVTMLVILAIIGLFPTLLTIIGNLFGFDLSCI